MVRTGMGLNLVARTTVVGKRGVGVRCVAYPPTPLPWWGDEQEGREGVYNPSSHKAHSCLHCF